MPKKRTIKKRKSFSKAEIESALVENFIKLQKVMTNMSIRFDVLSDNLTKLLQLFEISAKSFLQKQEEKGAGDKDLLKKVDSLLDQNRTIAQGLTLIEEKIKHKIGADDDLMHQHTDAELHGFYPGNLGGRPRPRSLPRM